MKYQLACCNCHATIEVEDANVSDNCLYKEWFDVFLFSRFFKCQKGSGSTNGVLCDRCAKKITVHDARKLFEVTI